ncbi:hypothetical protein 0305phi8-36p040 [Bacillus phage 0305phi8-36]|uniref:hypothetical protein n=1 Tax=Bacillus phage 0305phi8-36 TaxID=458639 RepID=UPI00015A1F84|nr:hypothetical protein ST0305phi8-36p040 [Bacillus phage 0305phi8-36]ABS83601.1 hypothetical protein 0305phi8-36p040 [Bacillus phage 0305phi8-36]
MNETLSQSSQNSIRGAYGFRVKEEVYDEAIKSFPLSDNLEVIVNVKGVQIKGKYDNAKDKDAIVHELSRFHTVCEAVAKRLNKAPSGETRLLTLRIDHEKLHVDYNTITPPPGFEKKKHNDSRLQRDITKVSGRFPVEYAEEAKIMLAAWGKPYADPELKAMLNK